MSYLEGKTYKVISRFFNRNSTGQKEVAWYIQSAERERPSNKKEYSIQQGYHSQRKRSWRVSKINNISYKSSPPINWPYNKC